MAVLELVMGRADVSVELLQPGAFVVLRDQNRGGSITNSAEAVCRACFELWKTPLVFYFDTNGDLDELVHVEGIFEKYAVGIVSRPVDNTLGVARDMLEDVAPASDGWILNLLDLLRGVQDADGNG